MSKISKTSRKNGQKLGKFVSMGGPLFCFHPVVQIQMTLEHDTLKFAHIFLYKSRKKGKTRLKTTSINKKNHSEPVTAVLG